ncbi:hypothetical protein GV827_21850 [Sulfitobacter sp. JBTF-M27]|uniref:Uncharacterized protein n=1 Tax=Sulfitobacter sediminilitoris TaxID=2698830 RepID=A0A6P0CJ56_9RHOB|nr:hypothetical protein [Sulfitobacter sediminilitoris]NEK25015.1 hypothetical protein [Sulfitobacter sediminilitoris]
MNVINPIDIANPIRSLPYVYLETTRSRRLIEQVFGVPYRRVPPVPSRDWRFLRHDVEMCDELVAFELTAKKLGVPFGYQPHIDADSKHIYPKVTIYWDGLTYKLRPQPDKTLIIGDTHYILEHDCGEETIECVNIIRDATIGRKHLVYDALFRSQAMKLQGWEKTSVLYVIDGKNGSKNTARKRIKSCLEKFPIGINPVRLHFVDRTTFLENKCDVSLLSWVRGDGVVTKLHTDKKP